MVFNYRKSYSAHDAAILATQVYVEREWGKTIEIFDAGADEIEIVGSLIISKTDLKITSKESFVGNYKGTAKVFDENIVGFDFYIFEDSISFGASRGFDEVMEKAVEEYLRVLKKEIMCEFLFYKEVIKKDSDEYYDDFSLCNAATMAFMHHYAVEQLVIRIYLFGKIQQKLCFDCTRMHNYYSRCLRN